MVICTQVLSDSSELGVLEGQALDTAAVKLASAGPAVKSTSSGLLDMA